MSMGKWIRAFFIFILLTAITQVGGIIYLLYKPIGLYFDRYSVEKWKRRLGKWVAFGGIYLIGCLLIVPAIATYFGRGPLPWRATKGAPVSPRNLFFPLANRHYVRPPLKAAILDVSRQLAIQYPGVELRYLDANFPFWEGFRLFPHLSHDDGKKLDICYLYRDKSGNKLTSRTPSLFGYGISEPPLPGEINQPATCAEDGYWQYSFIRQITPSTSLNHLQFDEPANRQLLQLIAQDHRIGKIFIEPHLKQRLGLSNYGKIRYHGCRAVRHDDHIHIQL
jgi:hypothetical protein